MFGSAPFRADIARGPEDAQAFWVPASDGLRLRFTLWPRKGARGTVILLTGTSEYAEKYGPVAAEFQARGFATLVPDWRGQGLSERPFDTARISPRLGHIASFDGYDLDFATTLACAEALNLPKPWLLVAHSLAGAVALRGLQADHPFAAVAFSAPMWGLAPERLEGPATWLARCLAGSALAAHGVPFVSSVPYVLSKPFAHNRLTQDPDMWAFLADQARRAPELTLDGPSLNWVAESLIACRDMIALPSPKLPCVTYLGTEESLVSASAIRDRMAGWQDGHLVTITGARHEIMFETPATRQRFFNDCAALIGLSVG